MKSTLALSMLTASALSSQALAAKVVPMKIHKNAPSAAQLTRRGFVPRAAGSFSETIINNFTGGSYMADVTVGTPAQQISLVLDTGSSDVWFLGSDANLCSDEQAEEKYGGCTGGTFDTSSSSTYELVNNDFDIQYADGTGAAGDYITDTFGIAGKTITDLQMGVGLNTTVNVGIMGVGYDVNEASSTIYPSVIDQMVNQSLINKKAYSLYLDDLADSSGTILFGGIDTDKYQGDLITLPLEADAQSGTISSFTVAWSSLSITGQQGNTTDVTGSNFAQPVVLDSGTTLSYLPTRIANKVFGIVGAVDLSSTLGSVFIDCDYLTNNPDATLNYGFGGTGGPVIKVAMDELIFPLTGLFDEGVTARQSLPFANTCAFGIMNAGSDGVYLLGDTFLRSAYVVYDIDDNQVALAQTNFNSTETNIVEIQASASGIPGVSGVATGVTVSATATKPIGVGKSGTATATSTAAAIRLSPALFDGSFAGVAAFTTFCTLLGASMILL